MATSTFILIAALVLGFSLSLTAFPHLAKKDEEKTFIPCYALIIVGFIALFFLNPTNSDAIYPLNILDIITALLFTGSVYFFKKFTIPLTILGSAICTYFLPQEFFLFQGLIPLVLDRIIIIAIMTAVTYCYKFLNGVDGIASIQNITITGGISLLFFIGAIPFLTASMAILLLGISTALLIYNWYPAHLKLNNSDCSAFGFIMTWLLLKISQEGCGSCAIILIMFPLYEILWAVLQKIFPDKRSKEFIENTNYYYAVMTGLPPVAVDSSVIKIQILMMIMSCFQLYAPNAVSVPIFALLIMGWFANKLKNWSEADKSIREINRDVLEDIKDSFKDFRK